MRFLGQGWMNIGRRKLWKSPAFEKREWWLAELTRRNDKGNWWRDGLDRHQRSLAAEAQAQKVCRLQLCLSRSYIFRPFGAWLGDDCGLPTTYVVGCTLSPLRGWRAGLFQM